MAAVAGEVRIPLLQPMAHYSTAAIFRFREKDGNRGPLHAGIRGPEPHNVGSESHSTYEASTHVDKRITRS